MRNDLLERKWEIFKRRVLVFKYIPFVEFIFLAGSMATGKVHEKSDFDLILGVREKRVWTAWLTSLFILHIYGFRARSGKDKSDKINISHVVAPSGYKLTHPYDEYWQNLYNKLIPITGDVEKINKFFNENDWMDVRRVYEKDKYYLETRKSFFRKFLEFIFGGLLGNLLERCFIKIYSGRVGDPKKLGYKPRLVYNASKLEMYRDTRRIEEMAGRK